MPEVDETGIEKVESGNQGAAGDGGAGNSAETAAPGATAPSRPAQGWTVGLREIMASVIALAIVALAVWMLGDVFLRGGEVNAGVVGKPALKELYDDAFNRQKDIMLYGLTLLGTVLGYYFGRVPAERRAEQAEAATVQAQAATTEAATAAGEAQRQSQAAAAKVEDTRQTLERVKTLRQVGAPRRRTLRSGGDAGPEPAANPEADAELDALARRLG